MDGSLIQELGQFDSGARLEHSRPIISFRIKVAA